MLCNPPVHFTSAPDLKKEKTFHIIAMFNDKRVAVNHDREHKFKLKYECVRPLQHPLPIVSFSAPNTD